MLILAPLERESRDVLSRVARLMGLESLAGVALLRKLAPADVDIITLGGYRVVVYADETFLRICRDADCAWPGAVLVYEA